MAKKAVKQKPKVTRKKNKINESKDGSEKEEIEIQLEDKSFSFGGEDSEKEEENTKKKTKSKKIKEKKDKKKKEKENKKNKKVKLFSVEKDDDNEEEEEEENKKNQSKKNNKKSTPVKRKKKEKKPKKKSTDKKKEGKKMEIIYSKGGAVVDKYIPECRDYHVIENLDDSSYDNRFFSCTLNKSNLEKNSNKFYIIQLVQKDSTGEIYFYNRWGRVGVKGMNLMISVPSKEKGINLFLKKYRDKTRGGYVELQIDYDEETDKKEKKKTDEKKKKEEEEEEEDDFISPISKKVEGLTRMIYDVRIMDQQMKEIGYDSSKMPLGKLGSETLKDGYEILKKIEKVLKKESTESLVILSSEFYTKIPHNFGYQKMINYVIDTKEKLRQKIEMMESLRGVEIATKIIDENKPEMSESRLLYSYYQKLGCTIRYIEPKEKIYSILSNYLEINMPSNEKLSYQNKLTLIDAYEVRREKEYEVFNDIGNKRLLWHGTRITNYVGILTQGLKIAPPEVPSSGYLFGKGLYFADMAQKSSMYCYPNHKVGLIILAEVALGNIEEREKIDYQLPDTMDKDSNSIKGKGRIEPMCSGKIDDDIEIADGTVNAEFNNKRYLMYNEYIVYNTNQVKLRYILKIRYD